MSIDEIKLEGSKENFTRLLNSLLQRQYRSLMNALDDEEASYRLGPSFDETVTAMGTFLGKGPIILAQGVWHRFTRGLRWRSPLPGTVRASHPPAESLREK